MNYQRSDISRCANCFETLDAKDECLNCSEYHDSRSPLALTQGTILNGNYQLGKVLGKLGGFGITYLAWDQTLQMKVAIKEYLPRELVGRDKDRATITPHSEMDGDDFLKGLGKFLEEARTLARIDHPSIVRVRSFFRENGTAYLVMDYYQGQTLEEYIRANGGKLSEERTIAIMMPVLDGLREVHAKGILHRDIKPDNIYLTKEGRVILLDFGAARQALQERSRSMTVILTPGFSPIEQTLGKGKQGTWTDVYGCAATMYYLITGVTPQRAEERLANDLLVPIRQLVPDCSYEVETALIRGMSLFPEDRFQTIHAFQKKITLILGNEHALLRVTNNNKSFVTPRKILVAGTLIIFILSFVVGTNYLLLHISGQNDQSQLDPIQTVKPTIANKRKLAIAALQRYAEPFKGMDEKTVEAVVKKLYQRDPNAADQVMRKVGQEFIPRYQGGRYDAALEFREIFMMPDIYEEELNYFDAFPSLGSASVSIPHTNRKSSQ